MNDAMVSAGLTEFLEQERVAADAKLAEIATGIQAGGVVAQAMRYALAGGGKRMRPALCVACYRAAGGDDVAIRGLGAALEIIHTYSLVHDDLPCMDNDDFRRGRETTHRVYGVAAAALAGAALIPVAFRVADEALHELGVSAAAREQAHRLLADAAGANGMVGGQLLDLQGEAGNTGLEQLEQIHSSKTGALIAAACVLGGVAAGAPDRVLDAFRQYGRHLGLAFQIADDVLDETASSAQLGKTPGKDRQGAKATYPALLGLDGARERARLERERAVAALREAGLQDALLQDLAAFAIQRRR